MNDCYDDIYTIMGILGDLGILITGYDDIGIMKNAGKMNMFTVESTNNIVHIALPYLSITVT